MKNLKAFLATFDTVQEIEKGGTTDKKYCVELDGIESFLRIGNVSDYKRFKVSFERSKMYFESGIPTPEPLEFNTYGDIVYARYEIIKNSKILANLLRSKNNIYGSEKKYSKGILAGQILKKIHNLKIKPTDINWSKEFETRLILAIETFKEEFPTGAKFPNEILAISDDLLQYFEQKKEAVAKRPNSILHGDFIPLNVMMQGEKMWIVDLGIEEGDPYFDFKRFTLNKEIETFATEDPFSFFSSGVIDGYFNAKDLHDIPMEFWELSKLYIIANMYIRFANNIWSEEVVRNRLENQLLSLIKDYKSWDNAIPSWYLNTKDKLKELNQTPEGKFTINDTSWLSLISEILQHIDDDIVNEVARKNNLEKHVKDVVFSLKSKDWKPKGKELILSGLKKATRLEQLKTRLKETEDFSTYLDLLSLNKENYIIVFCVHDNVGRQIPTEHADAILDLGFKTDLHSTRGLDGSSYRPFIAILNGGKVVVEKLGAKDQETLTHEEGNYFIKSSIKLQGKKCIPALITQQSINYCVNKRGLNIAIFSQELGFIVDSVCFDFTLKKHKFTRLDLTTCGTEQ